MKSRVLLLLVGLTAGVFSGCYYDKKEVVAPTPITPATCDTAGMTYTANIQSIMQAYCYSCHQGAATGANGITLDNYADLKGEGTELINRITSNDPSVMMPRNGPKLSDCDIAKISAWMNSGAPE